MSKSLAIASRLKPEIRLAQAISRFEADLSDEQKSTFRTLKSQSLNSPPELGDVMRFTAQIDRQMSNKAGRRCFGPRFTNFLQGVQQFAALGDVVVRGSQNIVACGVWSLVRMSLLSIMSYSSYIEKLSSLFMDIGRSAPRYQTMALLYPQSKRLQSALFEYFVIVVSLCHHLLKFTQRSAIQQVMSTLNDLDFKTFQTDLDRWAILIKEEISLVEAGENAQFKAIYTQRSKSAAHERKLATNLRVLDFCSKYDHVTTWKQTRKVGSTTLFTQLAGYQEWKDYSDACTLICTGKLGSGKSVLLANIVDDLNVCAGSDATIAYFFCRYDVAESLKARTIIGSLARQLLRTVPDLAMVAEECRETHSTDSTETLLNILTRGFLSNHKAYFILDGLDECCHSEKEALVKEFKKIQNTLKLLLLISFRDEPDSRLDAITEQLNVVLVTPIPDNNQEIASFIESELERCLKNRKLIIGDPAIILDIQDALIKGSQGMFLWVALQIQSLCDMRTDQAIRDTLADLPKTLSETFSRILGSLEPTYQKQILQLVLVAYRPLTIHEMQEALSVVSGDAVWTPSKLLNNIYSALACCGCLLVIDEEEFTIRFVHHSFQQFLVNEHNDSVSFIKGEAQRTIADIVVTYLNYGVFGTEVSSTRVPPIKIQSAPTNVIRTTVGSSSIAQSLALKLLKAKKGSDLDISKTLAEARKPFQSGSMEQFYFHSYAKTHWLDHIFYVSGQEPNIYRLSATLINRSETEASGVLNDFLVGLGWAIQHGNKNIIKALIDSERIDYNTTKRGCQELLWQAARGGDETMVRSLLDTDMVDVDAKDHDKMTPLLWAIRIENEMIVKLLLSTGLVNVNLPDPRGNTPLLLALSCRNGAIIKLLLNTGKIIINLRDEDEDEDGQTMRLRAIFKKDEWFTKLLLDTGLIDVNLGDQHRQTAVSLVLSCKNEAIIKLLLLNKSKLDINSRDKDGQTVLLRAISKRDERLVKLLLDTGLVDVNLRDTLGRTALLLSAYNGHEAVIRLLLGTGMADVNLMDHYGRTPLLCAVMNRHVAAIKMLLDTRLVDVNLGDQDGQTPMSCARSGSDAVAVELLELHGGVQWPLSPHKKREVEVMFADPSLMGRKF